MIRRLCQGWDRSGPSPPVTDNASYLAYALAYVPAARIGSAVDGSPAGSILVAAIWVPYLVRSRRVEATFIR